MNYRRYFRLGGRTPVERRSELEDEIESHIAMRAEDLVRSGEPADRARRLAEARFGNADAVFTSARERDEMLWRREGLTALGRDVQLGLRQVRRAPGAAVLTIATFALGIGLTTAMFSLVNGVLLRPLPYHEADRLVLLQGMDSAGNPIPRVSYPNWRDLAERNTTLESTALHQGTRLAVTAEAGAYRVPAQIVTPEFFDVLGTRMLYGRGFTEADAVAGPGALVISERLWRRELGGRRAANMTVRLENAPYMVIGVVPDVEAYPLGTDVWLPKPPPRRLGGFFRNYIGEEAIARLGGGVTVAAAEAELSGIARQIQASEPESDYLYGAPLKPLREHVVGDTGRYLSLLMGAVAIVLLLACANLAALNLARATQRTSEVVVRYALGGGRWAVIRQLVVEQLVMAVAGGVLGVLLAWAGTRVVVVSGAGLIPRLEEIGVDMTVLAFALLASVLAGVLAGLPPAWKASTASVRALVGGRGVVRGGHGVPGAALVGVEIAAAVLLLIGAGLLVRSFQSVLARDTGFVPAGVAAADVMLTGERYGEPGRRTQQWDAVLTRLSADPSIAAAAVANWIPTGRGGTGYLVVEGRDEDPHGAGYYVVSEGYFAAMGIPLLVGRTFGPSDRSDGVRVAVINRTLAERYWPGEDPIGRRLQVPGMEGPRETAPLITVVGVVGDVRHGGYEDERTGNQVYVLDRQVRDWDVAMTLIARHVRDDASAAGAVMRRIVRELDPALAVEPDALERRLGTLVGERRLVMSLLTAFGVVALLLSVIGVYGMLSFAVAQRTQELGIRAALGADRGGIVRLVIASAARVVLPGTIVGLLLALWGTRLLESMLVDVTRVDPIAWAGAVAVLSAVAFAAALVPAYRAARVDPLVAIRNAL
jgi:putative ABC transport system permease protein